LENLNIISYSVSAFFFLLLFSLSFWGLSRHTSGLTLIIASFLSLVWSGFIAYTLIFNEFTPIAQIFALESLRNLGWFAYLLVLITCINHENSYLFLLRSRHALAIVAFSLSAFIIELIPAVYGWFSTLIHLDIRFILHLIFAIIGLVLVEQLYRNSPMEQRWQIKFACLGLGGLFIYDFIIYSKALLFIHLDYSLWDIRGFINAVIVPLLIIALFRLKNQTKTFHFSQKMVFHSAALITTGSYLILMSLAGYYIKHIGGIWGNAAQIVFIFLAVLVLFLLLFSGKIRALFKVILNKHFVHYRYDYREQWLNISTNLAELDAFSHLSGFIIKTLANIVDSSGGGLWIKDEKGHFYLAEDYSIGFDAPGHIASDNPLIQFFNNKQWVIDLNEYIDEPRVYDELDISYWLEEKRKVWLIVPLYQHKKLQGFVVLTRARVSRKLNWEDHDVLKSAGMQLANALVLNQASEKLSVARQFEAYNRLSAFVVHDLKNVMAQIALIVKNSEKHKHNPEFIDDAIDTLKNSVSKMDNLVQQLKKGEQSINKQKVDLIPMIHRIISEQLKDKPPVIIKTDLKSCFLSAEADKIASVLTHLIQNAQQATTEQEHGIIDIHLSLREQSADNKRVVIEIIDNGCGMDEKFIAERLFKPFDTTKGNAGMGIGVYEARTYVIEHSGTMNVISKPGKGTSFIIEFPL